MLTTYALSHLSGKNPITQLEKKTKKRRLPNCDSLEAYHFSVKYHSLLAKIQAPLVCPRSAFRGHWKLLLKNLAIHVLHRFHLLSQKVTSQNQKYLPFQLAAKKDRKAFCRTSFGSLLKEEPTSLRKKCIPPHAIFYAPPLSHQICL